MERKEMKWLIDPKTNQGSVSLTLLSVSFLILGVLVCLEATEVVKNTSAANELFFACSAMYFGRRFQFKNSKGETNIDEEKK
jgi:hypothetical protein